jgi:arsenate reductase
MAEGLLRHMAGDRFDVRSAGTKPSSVRPEAVQVLGELGIDISGYRSKSVDEFLREPFDSILTVCDNAQANCPVFPGQAKRIHWSLDDPAALSGSDAERLDAFRRSRDQIRERLLEFIESKE